MSLTRPGATIPNAHRVWVGTSWAQLAGWKKSTWMSLLTFRSAFIRDLETEKYSSIRKQMCERGDKRPPTVSVREDSWEDWKAASSLSGEPWLNSHPVSGCPLGVSVTWMDPQSVVYLLLDPHDQVLEFQCLQNEHWTWEKDSRQSLLVIACM